MMPATNVPYIRTMYYCYRRLNNLIPINDIYNVFYAIKSQINSIWNRFEIASKSLFDARNYMYKA